MDTIYFYIVFHGNHKAAASVDYQCFYKVCPFRIHMDHNVWCLNLKTTGVGNIGGHQGCGFTGSDLILLVKGLQFFFLYALWGYEDVFRLYLTKILPTGVYTTVFTPLFYWGSRKLYDFYQSKLEL